ARQRLPKLVRIGPALVTRSIIREIEGKGVDIHVGPCDMSRVGVDLDQALGAQYGLRNVARFEFRTLFLRQNRGIVVAGHLLPGRRRASRRGAGLALYGSRWFWSRQAGDRFSQLLFF